MKARTYIVKLTRSPRTVSKDFRAASVAVRAQHASKALKTAFTLKGL